jgi:hypothetical protein
MITAWMRRLAREVVLDAVHQDDMFGNVKTPLERAFDGKEAGIVYQISNGFVVRTSSGFLFARDAKEVADHIVAEATRTKLGLSPQQLSLSL